MLVLSEYYVLFRHVCFELEERFRETHILREDPNYRPNSQAILLNPKPRTIFLHLKDCVYDLYQLHWLSYSVLAGIIPNDSLTVM